MKYLLILLGAVLLFQCGSFREKGIGLPQEELRIAVLPFTTQGPGLSEWAGHIAADRLTTYLYINKRIPVIDRSQVSYALNSMKLENLYYLSQADLQALAKKLNATVIVLGVLENRAQQRTLDDQKNKLTITLRFLDGKSGDISQILYQTKTDQNPPQQMIDEVLAALVGRL